MAQAVFDEHPLGDYLRAAGESQFFLPGISADLERELDPNFGRFDDDSDEPMPDWQPPILVESLQLLHSIVSLVHSGNASNPFVERFKYDVISSSLLSPSLPAHATARTTKSFAIPGRLHHSREPSVDDNNPSPVCPASTPESSYRVASLSATATAVLLSVGYPILSLLSFFATIFFIYNPFGMSETPKHDMTLSFNALEDLIAANSLWESSVQDTINFLEEEERGLQIANGSSTPSPIRVALHSCLQTTHTQCDNIRHLFSALTSPSELSQLAEMYAPPLPIKTVFSTEMAARPFSYPSAHVSPSVDLPSPVTPARKRFTWSGSYASLADAGSPTNMINRRRERQRIQLTDACRVGNNSGEPVSLSSGKNETAEMGDVETSRLDSSSSPSNYFGAAALDLQRKRRSGGLDILRSPPTGPDARSIRNSMFFSSTSSKFTNPQPARHPLSFTALTFSLQGALAAKRYACAHLLALRFSEDEDEGYWEDVRSVIGLLTSALADASSRLSEALEEAEQQKLQEQNPTPNRSQIMVNDDNKPTNIRQDVSTLGSGSMSFAPMPNHISRLAAHISVMSSALDDARNQLEQCVSALKAEHTEPPSVYASHWRSRHVKSLSRPFYAGNVLTGKESTEEEEPKALQAYERLRRELGLALRECERGRERMLEVVYPRPPFLSDDEEENEADYLPALGHDASDESDKLDPISPRTETDEAEFKAQISDTVGGDSVDDVTSHLLLMSTTQHLPMPGIEEVFEAETGPKVSFLRERSKFSREERINLAKARRESGKGLGIRLNSGGIGEEGGKLERERWGPGGEVVQELKDVIWKVGEKKRVKMTKDFERDPFANAQSVKEQSPSAIPES